MAKVKLGEKEFEIHLGIIEMDLVEEQMSKSIGMMLKEGTGYRAMVTVLWASITRFAPEFLPDNLEDRRKKRNEVLAMVDTYQKEGGNIKVLFQILMDEMSKNFPKESESKNVEGQVP